MARRAVLRRGVDLGGEVLHRGQGEVGGGAGNTAAGNLPSSLCPGLNGRPCPAFRGYIYPTFLFSTSVMTFATVLA